MENSPQNLHVAIWGILFSVSLGWAIYNLLNQWPRLLRFGSIWKGFLKRGKHFRRMCVGWGMIFILVSFSLGLLINEIVTFSPLDWKNNTILFPIVVVITGFAVFMIPIFINRAVWGFTLLICPGEFREFVKEPDNRKYWDDRYSIETTQKLYTRPKYAGSLVFIESIIIVLVLSLAVSGIFTEFFWQDQHNVNKLIWIFAPLIALLIAFLFHFNWPHIVTVDYYNLPTSLGGKLERRIFHDQYNMTWVAYVVDFQPIPTQLPCADRIRARRIVFCREDPKECFQDCSPDRPLCELSGAELRDLLEHAKQKAGQVGNSS